MSIVPRVALTIAVLAASTTAFAQTADRTAPPQPQPFSWPTPTTENRLWTRWWWLGNAVDEKNITLQLEKFHAAGIGGVEICPIYGVYGQEKNYIDFLSPKWMAMLAHTYRETARLGMKVDMTTGTGWPFGGSMVPDSDASQGIVLKSFDKLPDKKDFPMGKLVAATVYPPGREPVSIDPHPFETGAWFDTPPDGRWTLAFQTGPQQKVKRPAPGAEGNVLDPYSTTSLDHYLSVFDTAFKNFSDIKPRSQFHDSFEYYSASWTPNYFDEFQKRRGYDLRSHLGELNNETLGGANADTIARVKCDYRETLSDLHLAYMNRWVAWSHTHGGLGRNQAHGGPGNILDVYANADIPECEIFHLYDETQLPFLKLATSAAHVTGKPLASSESFTWLDEHFNASLAEVKPAADFLMLAGVNHMFLHGIPYSPEDAAWPGWNFYASVNFGPTGGLWHDFPAFTAYVARCQSILQANKPSADVLLYVPFHQFWSDPANNDKLMVQFTTPGTWMKPYPYYAAATALWENGYAYDEISDNLLKNVKVTSNGSIEAGGNEYHAIVIPKTPVIPLETMRHLMDLAKQGANIIFQGSIPSDVPGLADLANQQKQMKDLSNLHLVPYAGVITVPGIQPPDKSPATVKSLGDDVGKGHVFVTDDISNILRAAIGDGETMVHNGLRFVRRQRPDGLDYFVVNRSDKVVDKVPLTPRFHTALIMDPRSADRSGVAQLVKHFDPGNGIKLIRPNDRYDVVMTLQPNESTFIRTYTDRQIAGPSWINYIPAQLPMPLTGTWNVSFIDGGPVLPKSYSTEKLASWTSQPDPETQRLAGTAKYTLEFTVPPQHDAQSNSDLLDLGTVADSARVSLNGKPLATLWAPPYQLTLPSLPPGKNTLTVEVTNVAANRIRDMDARGTQWKIFRDANVLSTAYTAFDASNWPIRPAGLLGPVTLTQLKEAP